MKVDFNANPDTAFHSNANPDPASQNNPDPDENNVLTFVRSPRRAKLDCLTSGILS